MKNVRSAKVKMAVLFCVAVFLLSGIFTIQAKAYAVPRKVKMRVGKMTVTVGQTFQLKVKLTPRYADDDELVWSIVSGKNVVKFDEYDNDYDGDDMEFRAVKAGKAKICCRIRGTNKKTYATITVKAAPKSSGTIKRVGSKTRVVEAGDSFELEVKKSRGVRDRDLKWHIEDKKIVGFDDDDIYDDEMEFRARRAGTTRVTCQNRKTKQKVTFTIKVIREIDDDDYYDYPDEDEQYWYDD
ncbi:MAG: hypothetical protein NC412_03550 [Roseburia sp.]|nr:hypothetical protein [Roseburia sp.]MCM1279563.1 hypothetical protein [Robinsoniella sp.]